MKIHFLFLNCLHVSDKFRRIMLFWSNFNCQPADTVYWFDPARQSSISPHLSVISWQLRWYWKDTFFFLNWIHVSDKFSRLKSIWSNFKCQPADTVFRFDPVRQSSIAPHLSVISWQLRWYWKYTFFFLNWIQVNDKFRRLKSIWSNFNSQPADTVFWFDPARQSSISPHLSVIYWQFRWYWNYLFFFLNCIQVSEKIPSIEVNLIEFQVPTSRYCLPIWSH